MPSEDPDFLAILNCLARHKVDFIIVGGISAVLNGAPVVTFDLDIVHSRHKDNIQALMSALDDLEAHYRHQTRHLKPGISHLTSPGHQLLNTNAGPLDILGTIDEGKAYEQLLAWSHLVQLEEHSFHLLNLDKLIEIKQRAGRDKDHAVLPVLRNTLKEQ